ncbi:MAG: acyl-CoA dehydrogenase family protein, partial [Pseudomonadota bacterium]
MKLELNAEHRQLREEFRRFADEHIAPHADDFDREERLPDALIERLGARGYLLAAVPEKMGGAGMDAIAYGLLCEAMGRGSGSVANLMT